jgi:capsular exopolysaccharide synthesis family protein
MIKFSELLHRPSRSATRPGPAFNEVSQATAGTVDFQAPVEEARLSPESRVVILSDPKSAGADRFRYLRMCLREVRAAAKLRSLLITSPLPLDGKSTVALNLATTLSRSGKHPVLVIEADLHHPTLAGRLGIQSRQGLAECLEEGLDPMSALWRIEPLGWHLLQAGKPTGNPTELLQSELLPRIIQGLSSEFEWVLIDAPPLVPLTDAVSLSKLVDATLLVVRAGTTPRDSVEESLALLGPERVLGVVFNGADRLNRLYSKYYGYYGKG